VRREEKDDEKGERRERRGDEATKPNLDTGLTRDDEEEN
jgi:hypothetical protein